MATLQVRDEIVVGGNLTGVAFTPDARHAYATSLFAAVYVIDVATGQPGPPIAMPAGSGPRGVVVAPDGQRAFVLGTQVLYALDTTTHAIVDAIDLGSAGLQGLAVTPDGRTLVVIDPALVDAAFGIQVVFTLPAIAERVMYFGTSPLWEGGHASAGSTALSTSWFMAEGATGGYFNTFVLVANPNSSPADVTLTYFPSTGIPVTRTVTIPAGQRITRNIAVEDPSLANAAVATRVTSSLPVVAERSQYWGSGRWIEGHNSAGVTAAALRWALADGRVGGAGAAQTYVLLANTGAAAATVTATFVRNVGGPIVKTFTVPATSRFNVSITGLGSQVPELADESFGVVLESTQPIVVERSVYSNAGGVVWAAGTNAPATPLP